MGICEALRGNVTSQAEIHRYVQATSRLQSSEFWRNIYSMNHVTSSIFQEFLNEQFLESFLDSWAFQKSWLSKTQNDANLLCHVMSWTGLPNHDVHALL